MSYLEYIGEEWLVFPTEYEHLLGGTMEISEYDGEVIVVDLEEGSAVKAAS